jgi:hypothetical protein
VFIVVYRKEGTVECALLEDQPLAWWLWLSSDNIKLPEVALTL